MKRTSKVDYMNDIISVLTDPVSGKYVKGVGFQWAGKGAITGIHKRYQIGRASCRERV